MSGAGQHISWDSRQELELRQILAELRALEGAGVFDGLPDAGPPSAAILRAQSDKEEARGRIVARRINQARGLDHPAAPALSKFMTQIPVSQRTPAYKDENRRRFEEAVGQVRILYGRLARGEVASSSLIRSIVGSFMDTFMKDRNLLVNLAAHPCQGPDYLYDHSLKLCLLSLSLASTAGYSRSQAVDIAQGALLADVGMMLVPEAVRAKRGKLTESDQREIQKHPLLGLALLEPVHGLSEASLLIPLQHHERLSGTGYPDKRSGSHVSGASRIVGIADVFTALINKRHYREALHPYDAMVAILAMGGQGLLDGEQIRNFLRTLSIFPLGSLVRLSSGRIAKVVAPNPVEFTKPLVSILTTESGAPLAPSAIRQLDLAKPPAGSGSHPQGSEGESIIAALPFTALRTGITDGF